MFVTGVAFVEVAVTTVIAACRKQGQRVNKPAFLVHQFRLVLVQRNKWSRVVIQQEIAVEFEVSGRSFDQDNVIAPSVLVA